MSEKAKTQDNEKEVEIFTEIEVESGEGSAHQKAILKRWPMRLAARQMKVIGKVVNVIKQESPDLLQTFDIMGNLDLIMMECPDAVMQVLTNSLGNMAESDKKKFIDNLTVEQGIDMLEAVVKLNFRQGLLARLMNLFPETKEKEQE